MTAPIAAKDRTGNAPPSVCACVNLRRASRAVTRLYDQALEPSGMKVTQFSLLATIMHSGPINTTNLSRILMLDRTTLVRNLKSSEASGFIEEVATADPRERVLSISVSGRRAVEAALPHWRNVQRQLRDLLGREHLERLGVMATTLEALALKGGTGRNGG